MHHGLAVKNWDKKILNYSGNLIVRYTHDSVDLMNYVSQLNQVTAITVENSQSKIYLQNIGVNEELIHILPHPIDLKRFQNCSETKCRDVIFVSNFAERKNPQLIFDTIKFNPDLEFSILGKSWQNWPHFQKLLQLKNLKFLEFNYETYPKLLGQHKVFCSLSSLEGGPVPLIEALACNLNVVVTDTGHARDLIKYPRSYNIISLNSDFSVVGNSLRMALKEKRKLTDDLGQYSYEEYILKIQNLLFN
jgi:glycosyltransferase involved in cell wall biosynthesis